MKNEIKPCPFCGCDEVSIKLIATKVGPVSQLEHYKVEVCCHGCGFVKPMRGCGNNNEELYDEIVKNWNRRVEDERV